MVTVMVTAIMEAAMAIPANIKAGTEVNTKKKAGSWQASTLNKRHEKWRGYEAHR